MSLPSRRRRIPPPGSPCRKTSLPCGNARESVAGSVSHLRQRHERRRCSRRPPRQRRNLAATAHLLPITPSLSKRTISACSSATTKKPAAPIFFARYEASQFGSPRLNRVPSPRPAPRKRCPIHAISSARRMTPEGLRGEIERHRLPGQKIPTFIDLPLSNECQRVLAYAGEEAERLGHEFIGPGASVARHTPRGAFLRCHAATAIWNQSRGHTRGHRQGINWWIFRHTLSPPLYLDSFNLPLRWPTSKTSIDFYKKLGFTVVGVRGTGTAVLTNGGYH